MDNETIGEARRYGIVSSENATKYKELYINIKHKYIYFTDDYDILVEYDYFK